MVDCLSGASRAALVGAPVPYRPDVDGMRAIAILGVVLYHAGIGPFTGGFAGVDVFFVISGFLIMSSLTSGDEGGRLSLPAFYGRRVRRIFPALFAMMAVVTILAAATMSPPEFSDYGRSLIAAAISMSNVHFDLSSTDTGYFNNAGEGRLLLHTWSLSVEEQFYLLLPIALALLRKRPRRALATTLVLLAVASFVVSLLLVRFRPDEAFYLVVPRAWELLVGCLIALLRLPAVPCRLLREAASLAGLVLIAVAIFGFSRTTPFPGAAALLPCIGTALLIGSGSSGPTSVARVLAWRPSVYVGRISYSLYLWHWPVIVFIAQVAQVHSLESGELTRGAKLLILAISFAAAILSYHCVERPFRRPRREGAAYSRTLIAGGVAVAATLFVGVIITAAGGLPGRFDGLVAANLAQAASEPSEACYHYRRKVTDYADFRRCAEDTPKSRNIVVLGDSHAGSLAPLLRAMQAEGRTGGLGVVAAIVSSCPLSEAINSTRPDRYCNSATRFAYQRALEPDVDLVVIAFSPWWANGDGYACASRGDECLTPLRAGAAEALFADELDGRIGELLKAGKKVVMQMPIPMYDRSIPSFLVAKAVYGRFGEALDRLGIVQKPRRFDYASMTARLAAMARRRDIVAFDARAALCTGSRCDHERGGVSLYHDHSHIAANRIDILEEPLATALSAALRADGSHGLRDRAFSASN